MTAFNSIKTNNWPSASNDFEDFLVLELPLNDQAALTSSRRDIFAGSTVLHPKRTLTNTGVAISEAGANYSALISGTVDSSYPLSNLFGGTIGTGYTNGTRHTNPGTLTLTLTSLNITVTNVRLSTYIYATPSTFTVNGTTVPRGSGNGDIDYVVAVNGQLNTIAWSYDSSSGPYCYMKGIEVDYGDGNGYQLLTDAPGGAKKHYDNSASFNGSSSRLVTPANLNFGTGDFTVECWALSPTTSGEDGIFQLSTNVAGLNASQSDTVTLQTNSGVYRSYVNDSSYAFSTSVVANQWTHLALVRNAGTVRLYVNGVVDSTTVSDSRSYSCTHACIGGYYSTNYIWSGNIQDFRAYKGVAKYTANFTPPGAILG